MSAEEATATPAAAEASTSASAQPRPKHPALEGDLLREAVKNAVEDQLAQKVSAADAALLAQAVADPDAGAGNICLPLPALAQLPAVREFAQTATDDALLQLVAAALAQSATLALVPAADAPEDLARTVVRTSFKRSQRTTIIVRDVPADATEEELLRELFDGAAGIGTRREPLNGWWYFTFATEEATSAAFAALSEKKLRGETVHARIKTGNILRGFVPSAPGTRSQQPAQQQQQSQAQQQQQPADKDAAAVPVAVPAAAYDPQAAAAAAMSYGYSPVGMPFGAPRGYMQQYVQAAPYWNGYNQPTFNPYYTRGMQQQQQQQQGGVPMHEGGGRRGEPTSRRSGMRGKGPAGMQGNTGQTRRRFTTIPPAQAAAQQQQQQQQAAAAAAAATTTAQPQAQHRQPDAAASATSSAQPQQSGQAQQPRGAHPHQHLQMQRRPRLRSERPSQQQQQQQQQQQSQQHAAAAQQQAHAPRQQMPTGESWAALFPPLPTAAPAQQQQQQGKTRRYTRDEAVRVVSSVLADPVSERPESMGAEPAVVTGSPATTLESALPIVPPQQPAEEAEPAADATVPPQAQSPRHSYADIARSPETPVQPTPQ